MKVYKDFDKYRNEAEGKASRKRALIQSIKKWMMLTTVPAKRLCQAFHYECALCIRYHIDDSSTDCSRCCPLHKVGKECEKSDSPYNDVHETYRRWSNNVSPKNFRAYRKAARAMLAALQEAYSKLYGNCDICKQKLMKK
jgi:hypothetical protein